MNILEAVYCNQYFELKPKGKGEAARKNGTGLVTVALVLLFFAVITILVMLIPDLGDFIEDLIKDTFGRRSGRAIGKILALIPFLVFYPLINFTMGSEKSYHKIIEQFEALSEAEQEKVSKRGMWFFFISLGSIVITIGYLLN